MTMLESFLILAVVAVELPLSTRTNRIDGSWHLWDASIKRVENPDYAWLYE